MIGKIYKISCKSDPNLVYVGSTTQSLGQRLRVHKWHCRKLLNNMKLYQHVNNDWSNWQIELIEEVQYKYKNHLRIREGEYIKSIGTLNHRIEGREFKEYQKQYREDNKEKIKERDKEYYQKNKEEINKYHRDVYNANKHYRHTLLKKSFNAFKNHRADYIDG